MNLPELIRTRRTVHAYEADRPLPEGALERALEAAHWAPNHRFTYPWRFTLVGPETRARLVPIAAEAKARKQGKTLTPEESARLQAKVQAKVLNPSALIVLRQVLHDDPGTREEDYASLACAAQNAMLSLWAEGIGTKWSSGGVTCDPATYALLGVDPGRERIVGFLWAGYPAKAPSPPARPPLEEHVQSLP